MTENNQTRDVQFMKESYATGFQAGVTWIIRKIATDIESIDVHAVGEADFTDRMEIVTKKGIMDGTTTRSSQSDSLS